MKTDCLAGIQQFLLEKGFKRRGYIFYRIMDDIVQLVSFGKASFIYCTCCMMPLYIPNDFIYYTYGSRMAARLRAEDCADAEKMSEWTEQLACELEDKALPFFTSTDNPEKLLRLSSGAKKFMHCPPEALAELEAFTRAYLELHGVSAAADKALKLAEKAGCYTERVLKQRRVRFENLKTANKTEYFQGIIAAQKRLFAE